MFYFFFPDAEVPTKPCINGGNYNVTELSLKGDSDLCSKNGFNQVSIRCQEPELIQFLRECSNELRDSGKLNENNNVLVRGPWSIIAGKGKILRVGDFKALLHKYFEFTILYRYSTYTFHPRPDTHTL